MKKDAFIENLELDVIMLRKNAAALEDVKEVPISGKFMASIMKELAGLKE